MPKVTIIELYSPTQPTFRDLRRGALFAWYGDPSLRVYLKVLDGTSLTPIYVALSEGYCHTVTHSQDSRVIPVAKVMYESE